MVGEFPEFSGFSLIFPRFSRFSLSCTNPVSYDPLQVLLGTPSIILEIRNSIDLY